MEPRQVSDDSGGVDVAVHPVPPGARARRVRRIDEVSPQPIACALSVVIGGRGHTEDPFIAFRGP
jgi:hypothetical protein